GRPGRLAPTPRTRYQTPPDAPAPAPPDDATAPRAGPRPAGEGQAARAWASTGTDHRPPPRPHRPHPGSTSPGGSPGYPAPPASRRTTQRDARGASRPAARRPG